mgnify:CR=1 FL=1
MNQIKDYSLFLYLLGFYPNSVDEERKSVSDRLKEKITHLENENNKSYDLMASYFGKVFGEIFIYKDDMFILLHKITSKAKKSNRRTELLFRRIGDVAFSQKF